MDIKAKLRPFYVAQMLYERTDEEHYLTIAQMMEILEKEYGIATSRGTVSDDVKALQEFGLEIEVEPSTQNRYYLIGRKFDLPELKALIDATESARFITKEKSDALVKKLASLSSLNNATALTRNIDVENRIKAENEKIYYISPRMSLTISLSMNATMRLPKPISRLSAILSRSFSLDLLLRRNVWITRTFLTCSIKTFLMSSG